MQNRIIHIRSRNSPFKEPEGEKSKGFWRWKYVRELGNGFEARACVSIVCICEAPAIFFFFFWFCLIFLASLCDLERCKKWVDVENNEYFSLAPYYYLLKKKRPDSAETLASLGILTLLLLGSKMIRMFGKILKKCF